eukprot:1355871-Amphidinium_carterae.1
MMYPSVHVCVYADDVTLWSASKQDLAGALVELVTYYRAAGIMLSQQKSQYLVIGSDSQDI